MLVSIRQGFIMLMPVFMTGASALMLLSFPVPFIQNFINTVFNGNFAQLLWFIFESTFGLAAVFLLITVTFKYSSNLTHEDSIINVLSCIVAVASYVVLLGIKPEVSVNNITHQAVLISALNVQNIFSALFSSIFATRIFLFFVKKAFIIYTFTDFSSDIDYRTALRTLFPMVFTVAVFSLISVAINIVFDVASFNDLIIKLIVSPFEKLGRSIWSGLLILFTESLFWFFGMHGSNIFESVNQTVFSDIPGEIISKTFFDVFVLMGGCGTSISLLISIFLFSKLEVHKSLSRLALFPMLFNINEVIVFGLPIVLNPLMFIPFILTPLAALSLSYIAVLIGFVPAAVRSVVWTTPVLFSGYLATGSVKGILLQVVTITLGVFIYAPFIKIGNNLQQIKTNHRIDEMTKLIEESLDKGISIKLFSRNDYLSKAAKELAFDLRKSIENREIELFYQPQHDNSGRVVSCEALLRWKCPGIKYVFPPLVLEIAKEDGSFEKLTDCIIEQAICDTAKINSEFGSSISVSINIDSSQVNNISLIHDVIEKVNEKRIIDYTFGIEITEESELRDNGRLEEAFTLLHNNHIKLAIDDFSTGHTSLVYLQSNKFDFVKLDGSLVRKLMNNERSIDIIKSITDLGKTLEFDVIAEYVETEEQKNLLENIGCSKYQGYLYSQPLTLDDFIKYVKNDRK